MSSSPSSPRGSFRPSRFFPRGGRSAGLLLGLLLLACGCTEGSGAGTPTSAAAHGSDIAEGTPEVRREVRDLVTASSPASPSASAAEKNDWFGRRKTILERLCRAGPEIGLEALRVYFARPDAPDQVREDLLDVAAHTVPERTQPLLVDLVTTFGEADGLRAAACKLLAQTSPQIAADVLGTILREERPRTTYPPQEKVLAAWLIAIDAVGSDPVELLSAIAVDLHKDGITRTIAIRALGDHPSDLGRQALETVLVESSGNHNLRRVAVQSLLTTIPVEEFCPLMRGVFDMEVDTYFQSFLADVLEKHCR